MLILQCHPERSRSIGISKIENYCEAVPLRGAPPFSRFLREGGRRPKRFQVPEETDRTGSDLGFESQNLLEPHMTITAAPSIESSLSAIKASLA